MAVEELQPAFVLHTRPWRETSLLVELLTLDGGRIGLVARGVRGAKSKRKGLLQPFLPLLVSYKGRGELKNLSALEAVSAPLRLLGSQLYCGLYINELLMRLLAREIPVTGLFARYRALLVALSCGESAEPLLRRFELALLQDLGVLPSLATDADGTAVDADLCYRWVAERGFVASTVASAGKGRESPYSGGLLQTLAATTELPQDHWPEAKRLSRQLLQPLLGSKPLASRRLFQRQSVAALVQSSEQES